jgi:hypothetical protein
MTHSIGANPDPDPAAAPPTPVPGTDAERAQLRADLDELRSGVGDTVAELTARVDVPARVKAETQRTLDRARQVLAEKTPVVQNAVRERPVPVAAIVGGALLVVLLLIVRRRRASS